MPAFEDTSSVALSPEELKGELRDRVLQGSKYNTPFSSLEWFQNLYQHGFPLGGELTYILGNQLTDSAVSCLPVVSRKRFGSPNLLEGLSNYYSPIFAPLLAPGGAPAMADALARHIRDTAHDTDVINFRPMDTESRFFQDTTAALRQQGYWADQYYCFGNWYLQVQGRSYDEYFQGLSSKIRKNTPRERRRLQDHGMSVKIISSICPDLEWAIQAYKEVYAGSWKRPEPYPNFIPSLCRLAAEQSWLRLGILCLEDVPVAAQLWLVKDKVAYIYKLAYSEAHAKHRAGTALTCDMMKYVIDTDKVHTVDYGMGDDPYKKEWMSHRRERFGLIAFNSRRPLGILAAARHFGGKLIKPLIQRWRPDAVPSRGRIAPIPNKG